MSDEHPWTVPHDRTAHETLRALMRWLDPETPTNESIWIAFRRIQGVGPGDEAIVEHLRETVEKEHVVVRAKRWYCGRDDPPAITIPAERTIDRDTETTVACEDVCAAIGHFFGERERTCENPGGVIDCTGPVGSSYRWPDCLQPGRREEAILDALRDRMVNSDHPTESLLTPAVTDEGDR